jgi:hypothetical protein
MDLDYGIDLVLRAVEVRDQQCFDAAPQLDVQLKSTRRAEVRADQVVHDLEVRRRQRGHSSEDKGDIQDSPEQP